MKFLVAAALGCVLGLPAHAQGVIAQRNLSSAMVKNMLVAAVEFCQQKGMSASIAILDRSGAVCGSFRDEGAAPHTLELSQRKAYTALTFRMPSADFAKRALSDPQRAPQQNLTGVIALGGELPIKIGDEVIGAISVSGTAGGAVVGSNDVACGQAGIERVADRLR
ncbi:MAG: heme-binding protein [Rhodospirillales bacterium]|nr:heme-binding protein [Rhodospirillales bacterium]